MATPIEALPSSKIEIISSYERQIIAVVGEARLLELYRLSRYTTDHIKRHYNEILLSPEDFAKMTSILGKDCLLSITLLEFEQFIRDISNNAPFDRCVDYFENESIEMLKEVLQTVNLFDCRVAIELRDIEMLKKFAVTNKGGYSGLLRFADEYTRAGNPEEIQKSQAIFDWIESEKPEWK